MPPSRIYKGTELVYQRPDSAPLTAFLPGLATGTRIQLFRAANVRTDAVIATNTLTGVNLSGTRGTIRGGPKTGVANSIWYDINFDTGHDGWVVSDNYTVITSTTTETTPATFRVGDSIRLFRRSNVRSSAAIATNLLRVAAANETGTITQGPTRTGTINWYRIDFATGADGWVASDNFVKVNTTVVIPAEPVTPPVIPGTCNQLVGSPTNAHMCSKNWPAQAVIGGERDNRISCAVAPGGGTAVMVSELQGRRLSLQNGGEGVPGVVGASVAMVQYEMFIPSNYVSYSSQRFPLGISVQSNGAGCGGVGGCLPEEAKGTTIRLTGSRSNGSFEFGIYSYHLNRNAPRVNTATNLGLAVTERMFGSVQRTTRAAPKGEWLTIAMRLVLNTPGQANGSSTLWVYRSDGTLFETTTINNAIYRRDATWTIRGIVGDTKSNTSGGYSPPVNQAYYLKNWRMYRCS